MYSGTTQAKMSQELFMSEAQYNRKENGQAKIELHEARKMARLLELSEDIMSRFWMADKIYELMKIDKDLFYAGLKIVEFHFDNYETCVEIPNKDCSYSSLDERLKQKRNKN